MGVSGRSESRPYGTGWCGRTPMHEEPSRTLVSIRGVDGHRCTKNQPERWCPSVVQTAAKRVVEPIGEAGLEPNAYGYRRKRSAQDAIRKVQQCLRQGYTEGVDADRSKYFDTIPHAERMASGYTAPFLDSTFSVGAWASSHRAMRISQEYKAKPIPGTRFKRQE